MKLGELFVDLGVNSGNALNSLTNFSIKFLALKNAASQFGEVFDALFGATAKYGQQLTHNNMLTGQSVEWMQKMKFRVEQVGGSLEDVMATMRHLQKMNADVLMGKGLPEAIGKLNIDVSKMREPTELLDEIMSKLMRFEPGFRDALVQELNISENIVKLYMDKTAELDEQLYLTEDEVKELNKLQKEWVALSNAVGATWDKAIAKITKYARVVVRGLASIFGVNFEDEESLPSTKNSRTYDVKKIEDKKTIDDLWGSFKKNIGTFQIGEEKDSDIPQANNMENDFYDDSGDYEGLTGQELNDFIREGNPEVFDYNRSLFGLPPLSNINYNDNSQVIINTSEGAKQYEQIAINATDKRKREVSRLEQTSRRSI